MSTYSKYKLKEFTRKALLNAPDVEYAATLLEETGVKEKIINDYDAKIEEVGTLAWWLNKAPLRSFDLGSPNNGKTAQDLGIEIVSHETNNFQAYENITRSSKGRANVFISRGNVSGEAAVYGDGFYTNIGTTGARGTGITIRFKLHPDAVEGKDFKQSGSYIIVLNKNALTLIQENINISVLHYLKMLSEGIIDKDDRGLVEKIERKFTRIATLEELKEGLTYILSIWSSTKKEKLFRTFFKIKNSENVMSTKELILLLTQFEKFEDLQSIVSNLSKRFNFEEELSKEDLNEISRVLLGLGVNESYHKSVKRILWPFFLKFSSTQTLTEEFKEMLRHILSSENEFTRIEAIRILSLPHWKGSDTAYSLMKSVLGEDGEWILADFLKKEIEEETLNEEGEEVITFREESINLEEIEIFKSFFRNKINNYSREESEPHDVILFSDKAWLSQDFIVPFLEEIRLKNLVLYKAILDEIIEKKKYHVTPEIFNLIIRSIELKSVSSDIANSLRKISLREIQKIELLELMLKSGIEIYLDHYLILLEYYFKQVHSESDLETEVYNKIENIINKALHGRTVVFDGILDLDRHHDRADIVALSINRVILENLEKFPDSNKLHKLLMKVLKFERASTYISVIKRLRKMKMRGRVEIIIELCSNFYNIVTLRYANIRGNVRKWLPKKMLPVFEQELNDVILSIAGYDDQDEDAEELQKYLGKQKPITFINMALRSNVISYREWKRRGEEATSWKGYKYSCEGLLSD